MKNATKFKEIKAPHIKIIEECERIVKMKSLTSHPFVVGRDGLYVETLGLDKNSQTTGEFTMTNNPARAMGFTREDARSLAAIMKNGNGAFESQGRIQAAREAIKSHKGCIEMLSELYAGS